MNAGAEARAEGGLDGGVGWGWGLMIEREQSG